jgi:hypothetical protein
MNNLSIFHRLVIATLALLAVCLSSLRLVQAESIAPQLIISQFKITSSNGQFFTLYNTTDQPLDMTKFQLEYFNHYDISRSTSSKFISLSGTLPPHTYYMVSDAVTLLCYQQMVNSVSLGLSSTTGMIQLLSYSQSSPGGSVMPTLQDYVGWSKTAAAGAQTLPTSTAASLKRLPLDTTNHPALTAPGGGNWQAVQADSTNSCSFVTVPISGGSSTPVPTGLNQLLPSVEPAATIVSIEAVSPETSPSVGLPAADVGLMAPQITEILPNPLGSGTDDSDEFIELYNPNATDFDLTGFSLRSGITSLHSAKFSDGTTIAPKSFRTFYSRDLNLSLSNSGGQVALLDPFGTVIGQTEIYEAAKDGQAWVLAFGKWYWSTTLTPGAANVVVQPINSKSKTTTKSVATAKKTTSGQVKGATTKLSLKEPESKQSIKAVSAVASAPPRTPLHPQVLALIACAALLYGAYEYRADLGNRIHQLRKYLASRRAHRV